MHGCNHKKRGAMKRRKDKDPSGPDIHALAQVIFELLLARVEAMRGDPAAPSPEGDAGTLAKSEPQTRDRAGGDLDPCG